MSTRTRAEYLASIPRPNLRRDAQIRRYKKAGKSAAWIGAKYGISRQRVAKIVAG